MRHWVLGAVVLGVVAVGVIAAASALAGGSQAASAMTVKVVEHATTDAVTETGKKGDSAGDLLTFANAVYNAANTSKVGSDNGWCIRTVVGKSWECFWTTSVANGQITVEGPFLDSGDSKLAITGGTGGYATARGWMLLHARNDKGTEYDFVFHLSG
jgi:allene oxide cyclase